MKFWHWHKWTYLAEPITSDYERDLLVAFGYKELSGQRFYRYCIKCKKFQALDVDGWCDYVSKYHESLDRRRLGVGII